MNGSDAARWPASNAGRWPRTPLRPDADGDCRQCPIKRPLTRTEADVAAARAMGLFEVYECPSGLGWHLRVVKNEGQD